MHSPGITAEISLLERFVYALSVQQELVVLSSLTPIVYRFHHAREMFLLTSFRYRRVGEYLGISLGHSDGAGGC